jgi:tetratricopeptide (TPR) repeat protein
MQSARIFGVGILLLASSAAGQESAIDAAKSAAASSASDPQAALAYGRALRRAGKYDAATAELRRGIAIARASDALATLHWEIARVHIDKRDFSQAMVSCKVVGAQTGQAARGHACTAEAHLLWRRGSEALTETAAALAGGNKLYEAKVAEARAHGIALKDSDAEASFKEAIAWKPDDPWGHFWYGRFLIDTGKVDAGVAELKTVVAKDPNDPEVAYQLGRALGLTSEAAPHLERAVKERPGFMFALTRQAEVLVALGRVPEARKAADAALKTGVSDATIHVALGRVSLGEGKPDEALASAKTAQGIMPNSAGAKLLTADAYAAKKEIDLAVEAYQSAYGLDHSEPTALVHASDACRLNGRTTSAKAFGDKATKEFPTWGPGWVAYGDALAADKEPAAAKKAYETALSAKGPVDQAAVRAKIAALK